MGITIVNVIGSFALGLLVGLSASDEILSATEPLTIGFLGGFTTSSTWMVDIDEAPTKRTGVAISLVPLVLGLVAAAAGLAIGLSR